MENLKFLFPQPGLTLLEFIEGKNLNRLPRIMPARFNQKIYSAIWLSIEDTSHTCICMNAEKQMDLCGAYSHLYHRNIHAKNFDM